MQCVLAFDEECISIYLFSLAAALNSEIWALQKIFLTELGDNLSAFVQSQMTSSAFQSHFCDAAQRLNRANFL